MNRLSSYKEMILFGFTILLVASYFACLGYYNYFNIDISSYLSIQDLTMIYVKWIGLAIISCFSLLFLMHLTISKLDNQKSKKKSYWSKTIGNTLIKRRVFVVLPILIGAIILCYVYVGIDVISIVIAIIAIVFILIIGIYATITDALEKKSITFDNFQLIIVLSFILSFAMPYFGGLITAANVDTDNISIELNDNALFNTKDYEDLIYIGKTSGYYFIYDIKTKNTTAYPMSNVKSFTIK